MNEPSQSNTKMLAQAAVLALEDLRNDGADYLSAEQCEKVEELIDLARDLECSING